MTEIAKYFKPLIYKEKTLSTYVWWITRPSAGGATWGASTPGGLHSSAGLQPRSPPRTAVAGRIRWGAEPVPTRRRPMSSGKQRVGAPGAPPGDGATPRGQEARRERREGLRPSRDVRQPAQPPGRRDHRGRWEGCGRAYEPVGAKMGGSCDPQYQAGDSCEVTPQQGDGALGHDGQRGAPPQDAAPESGGPRQHADERGGTPCGARCMGART